MAEQPDTKQQPTSMVGHMYVAAKDTLKVIFMNPVARFVGRTFVEFMERSVPHGANELGNAIFAGSAYAPPVLHSPHQDKTVVAQPKAEEKQETQAESQQQPATGWGQQSPWGHRELGYSPDYKIIDMKPQIESYEASMRAQTARLPRRQPEQGMER